MYLHHIYIYCYSFGSSADPFSQDPTWTATPFTSPTGSEIKQVARVPKLMHKRIYGTTFVAKSVLHMGCLRN